MRNLLVFIFILASASILLGADAPENFITSITGGDEVYKADVKLDGSDKRLYVNAFVSNDVGVIPGAIGDRYFEFFKNGGSDDMRVDGSSTPVVFSVPISSTKDSFISQVRCFGSCNGIKFDQHLCKNTALATGIVMELKSDDLTLTFPYMTKTDDWKNLFSFPLTNAFKIDIQAGADQLIAIFNPTVPFPLRKTGTFSPDDYLKITINDNLSGPTGGNLKELRCLAEGFRKTP